MGRHPLQHCCIVQAFHHGNSSQVVPGTTPLHIHLALHLLTSLQFLVGLFASLGSLLYGYDLGVIAQVIASQSFKSEFNPTDNETWVYLA